MDYVVKKQIGYAFAAIWAAWGLAILAFLLEQVINPLIITAIEGTWYAVDALMVFFIHYYFNIEIRTPDEQFKIKWKELTELAPTVKPQYAEIIEKINEKLNE